MNSLVLACFSLLVGGGFLAGATLTESTPLSVGLIVVILGGCAGLWKAGRTNSQRLEARLEGCINRMEEKNDRHLTQIFDRLDGLGQGQAAIESRCHERGKQIQRLESKQ